MILQTKYLLTASILSKAYARLCAGTAAALRMGLHVSSPALRAAFSNDELFQRRRVFATLNMMDTYFSSVLGMPKILRDADFEQTLGLREEDLADEGQRFILQDPTSHFADAVLCQKLNNIIAKILGERYPIQKSAAHDNYTATFESLAKREAELERWHNGLPALPQGLSDPRTLRAQLNLRLWYPAAQITLYRPFLHHLARDRQDPDFNIRGYECGSACVRAAMQAVWLVEAFETYGVLHEAHWLILYLLGFSASILAYFVVSSKQRETIAESATAARKAERLLGLLGRYNLPARRCFTSLRALLDALPVPRDGEGRIT